MYVTADGTSNNAWNDFTLIMPAVSVGNVGQLTVDLLVSSLPTERVGYLYDDSVLPVIGNDPFTTANTEHACHLMTAIEVYECKQHKLVIVQQRAPLVKGKKSQFLAGLMDWIHACQFARVIIPTSSYAHERRDKQLSGSQLRFLTTPQMESLVGQELRSDLGWLELERRSPPPDHVVEGIAGQCTDIFLPGGGIAKSLYEKCLEVGIAAAVVLVFCSEGDNGVDAIQLATHLNSWLHLMESQETGQHKSLSTGWKIPPSWKLQFGRPFQQILF